VVLICLFDFVLLRNMSEPPPPAVGSGWCKICWFWVPKGGSRVSFGWLTVGAAIPLLARRCTSASLRPSTWLLAGFVVLISEILCYASESLVVSTQLSCLLILRLGLFDQKWLWRLAEVGSTQWVVGESFFVLATGFTHRFVEQSCQIRQIRVGYQLSWELLFLMSFAPTL
jgi:hypothetical protein